MSDGNMANVQIDNIGGACPVQAEGTVNGVDFYFRARGNRWQMAIGKDPVGIMCGDTGFLVSRDYGEKPFAAGFMPLEVARGFIHDVATLYSEQESVAAIG